MLGQVLHRDSCAPSSAEDLKRDEHIVHQVRLPGKGRILAYLQLLVVQAIRVIRSVLTTSLLLAWLPLGPYH